MAHATVNAWDAAAELPHDAAGKIPRAAGLAAARELVSRIEGRERERGELAQLRHELLVARRDREQALARLRIVDADVAEGRYVDIAAVQADAGLACEKIRTRALAVGARVALELEAICARPGRPLAPAIQVVVDREINSFLAELNATRFSPPAPTPAIGGGP